MQSLFDMISAFVAMLISAALLHFGASGDAGPPAQRPQQTVAASSSAAVSPADDAAQNQPQAAAAPATPDAIATPAPLRRVRHDVTPGARPMVEAVRMASPLRRG